MLNMGSQCVEYGESLSVWYGDSLSVWYGEGLCVGLVAIRALFL